jgi:truncated hemoglobin YjbI/DNA-binding winged helix-turn-helix (wHTH) protein
VIDALADDVLAVCVGPVAAAPLERLSVRTVQPDNARVGALVHALTEAMQGHGTHVTAAGHRLEIRGTGALVDGVFQPLPLAPMAALRVLARQPGRVVSPAELRQVMPTGGEERAVEMAISRLRQGLGHPKCVVNVVKRGYRLDCAVARGADRPLPEPAPLLTSVGGTAGLRSAVELLYLRLVDDPHVAHHFRDVDLPRLKRHQVLMLASLLGSPEPYSGRHLARAHQGLGITSEEYRRVLDHLEEVVTELGDAGTARAVRLVLEALEGDVVGPVARHVTDRVVAG